MNKKILRAYVREVNLIGWTGTAMMVGCLVGFAVNRDQMTGADWFFVAFAVASMVFIHGASLFRARRMVRRQEAIRVQWNEDHPYPDLQR